jgi:hypothetical protein
VKHALDWRAELAQIKRKSAGGRSLEIATGYRIGGTKKPSHLGKAFLRGERALFCADAVLFEDLLDPGHPRPDGLRGDDGIAGVGLRELARDADCHANTVHAAVRGL